ncbi:MAG TPA: ATPase P [Casimicrobiaceae bacterium]|nr:ATPase P [Casimicrobiaceae bacterium]
MLEVAVPGGWALRLRYLVADFNGTLAVDGVLIPGVAETLRTLAPTLEIHVVTADTFGRAQEAMAGLPCATTILPPGDQDSAKRRYVERLGAGECVCIGNGRNDRAMLAAAGLGIAVIQREGAAVETLLAAKVAVPDIGAALGLLLNPARLTATLRL